jgi:type II secretory pathway pseudopilin PulG
MRSLKSSLRRPGFMLMEVVLAIGIFAMVATGFAIALAKTSDLAQTAQRRMQVNRILDSALTEALSWPALEPGTTSVTLSEEIGGATVDVDTVIELIEDMENEDGELLQQMFRIEVSAHWYENGSWQKETAETWRYARLYMP